MVLCFTKYLLNERHNLSKIWLAAHYEKKIKRNQVFEVDIERSVQDILSAEIFFDLKVSGHLLVGIVKIHSRKCKYLLTECSDVLYQVKLFRVGVIDLPDSLLIARINDITLPEVFDDLDVAGNDMIDAILSSHQSHVEDITLKETHENLRLLDEIDMMDFKFDENAFDEDFIKNYDEEMCALNGINLSNLSKKEQSTKSSLDRIIEGVMIENNSPLIETPEVVEPCEFDNQIVPDETSHCLLNDSITQNHSGNVSESIALNQDMNNELYLQPIKKVSAVNTPKNQRKKKRKLTIDYLTAMSYDMMKKQRLDTSDIVSAFDLAPATKRLMALKEIGRAKNLFCLPVQNFLNADLSHLYKRHLKTQKIDKDALFSEEESQEGPCYLRKRSRLEGQQECVGENQMDTLDVERNFFLNDQNDIPVLDNSLNNLETSRLDQNIITKNKGSMQTEFSPDKFAICNTDELQNTQISKTSESSEMAVHGRIIEFLTELKTLLKYKMQLPFSSLVKNKKKFQVAQRFLCLLMLKKLQIVSLQQPRSFDDIIIQPSVNFDSDCSRILELGFSD